MRLLPTWQQFKNWSLPNKITVIAFILGTIYFIMQLLIGASKQDQKEMNDQLSKIDKNILNFVGEEIPRDEIVKKSLSQREGELSESLALLEDAIVKIQEGNDNYFKIVSGQLRALICFGNRSLNPLLLNLAEEKNIKLECYGYSVRIPIHEKTVLVMNPGPAVSVENPQPPRPTIRKAEFKKWLNLPYLVIQKYVYTPNEVIRMVAEKEGGSHYDDATPEKLLRIKEIIHHQSGGQYNEIQKLLFQTTLVVLHYGKIILSTK